MQQQPLKVIRQGCPICHSDIIGSKEARYLCRKCFIFFDEVHIKNGLF